jgi:hypothetical protein
LLSNKYVPESNDSDDNNININDCRRHNYHRSQALTTDTTSTTASNHEAVATTTTTPIASATPATTMAMTPNPSIGRSTGAISSSATDQVDAMSPIGSGVSIPIIAGAAAGVGVVGCCHFLRRVLSQTSICQR